MAHFADRLVSAARDKGNAVCVGLDPRWEMLPGELTSKANTASLNSIATTFETFCLRVLDIVAPLVPAVKPQSAFFEAIAAPGMQALANVLRRARELGLITILDNKRGDIATTAEAYADAAFAGTLIAGKRLPIWDADAVTINPYLGRDAVEPFLTSARRAERGVFVLARTSNKGSGLFQSLICDGKPLYLHVAKAIDSWSQENLGNEGYGDVGAVVGATHPAELAMARQELPHSILLVPGYGAQGGTAEEIRAAFHAKCRGAVVNSSRGIVFPFEPTALDWEAQIEKATKATIEALS